MQTFLNLMQGLAARAQAVAEALGGPGLAIVAFVDSSFLTLPEVADFLVILLAIRSPHDWPNLALWTTVGSVVGSYALYAIGRKGGEALLRRRFHERHVDRFLGWFSRYGAGVLVVPAMLPPPTPFKLFVLVSGVSGVARSRFIAAVAIGRGLRYGAEAYLATVYGEAALKLVQTNALQWVGPVVVALLAALAGFLLWRIVRRLASKNRRPPGAQSSGVE